MSVEVELRERYAQARTRLMNPQASAPVFPTTPAPCSQDVPNLSPLPQIYVDLRISLPEMLEYVANAENVHITELKSHCRTAHLSLIRQVFYYLAKKYCHTNPTQISRFINRDHTTVLYGIGKVEDMMVKMPWWREYFDNHHVMLGRLFPRTICPCCGTKLTSDKERADSCESALR
jgi:hypothetical protein